MILYWIFEKTIIKLLFIFKIYDFIVKKTNIKLYFCYIGFFKYSVQNHIFLKIYIILCRFFQKSEQLQNISIVLT